MRPEQSHGASFDVAQILDQLDHLVDAASHMCKHTSLDIMKVNLEHVMWRILQGDCHERFRPYHEVPVDVVNPGFEIGTSNF